MKNKKLLVGFGLVALSLGMMTHAQSGRTRVVWFVGLGTGTNAPQAAAQKAAVERYNKSQDKIELVLEIVNNAGNAANQQLATRIAAGNPPDLVGPVGVEGAGLFQGQWAKLDAQVAKFKPDLSNVDDALVKFYQKGQGGEGLPYAVYPSFLYVNKSVFDDAKLPYPPQKFGDKYQGQIWDWNALRRLAMKLTVDSNGKSAGQPGFDPKKIVQYGYEPQWTLSMPEVGVTFGSGRLVDGKGNAQLPPQWVEAWKFFYNGIWRDHFIPTSDARNLPAFGTGNVFNSGKVAMGFSHLWYTCCLDAPSTGKVKDWQMGVVPSYLGKATAKLNADTFRITKGSKVKDEAFQAMIYLMQQPDLLEAYGAFPADATKQASFKAGLDKKYAPIKINWSVATDSLKYVDSPNHQSAVPNYLKAKDIMGKYMTKMLSTPNLNLDQEFANMKGELQRAYDEKR